MLHFVTVSLKQRETMKENTIKKQNVTERTTSHSSHSDTVLETGYESNFSYPWRYMSAGLLVLAIISILSVSLGSVRIPTISVLEILFDKVFFFENHYTWPSSWETIIWDLRLPRIILAGTVGMALSIAGASYQGLFRNPLADPYLIGVASGAGLGATVVMLSGIPIYILGINLLPISAFAGGILAITSAYLIAKQYDRIPLTGLILAGVAIASFCSASTSLIMLKSNPELRPILSWLLGGFINAQWKNTAIILPYIVPSVALILIHGRILNLLHLEEEQAKQLGVHVERTKLVLILSSTLATAAAVSFCGLIGFVGLVSPHLVRLIWGNDYRFLLPMSGIVGATFLIAADLIARTIINPTEIPVGLITAFVGAPFFLYLLKRNRRISI